MAGYYVRSTLFASSKPLLPNHTFAHTCPWSRFKHGELGVGEGNHASHLSEAVMGKFHVQGFAAWDEPTSASHNPCMNDSLLHRGGREDKVR